MSGYQEPGINIVSWRIAASTIHLCERCRESYGTARYCEDCLRLANANPGEKRDILFPETQDRADMLSDAADPRTARAQSKGLDAYRGLRCVSAITRRLTNAL
jgi:hypothetical protein